jgi:hypothetical protein
MTTFGQACLICRKHPAIRTDGLCAGCGEEKDSEPGFPRLRYGLRSFVIEHDEEHNRTLIGGLGGLGVGQMWRYGSAFDCSCGGDGCNWPSAPPQCEHRRGCPVRDEALENPPLGCCMVDANIAANTDELRVQARRDEIAATRRRIVRPPR